MPRMGGYVPADHKTRHQDGGRDEISIASLSGDPADTINESLLTTRGDMIRRSATVPERFAKGTSGKLLRMGANDPDWSAELFGEGHITILPIAYNSIGQGTWSSTDGAVLGGAYLGQSVSIADGDNISYKVYLDAGTYTLAFITSTHSDMAILDFDIDDVEVASFDCYSATFVSSVLKTQTGIVVSSAGLKTLKARVHGKNASATSYQMRIQAIILWRTA
uniref:Uncharacterized protein n=1 Tax=viral metagenome TaxID=1070528 RepID=A0A6M3Y030_9ZZZZ